MKRETISTGSRQFVRDYSRFKRFAAKGGTVAVTDREGHRFVFMLARKKQHPPRRAERPLDPKLFAGIDLDAPALEPSVWAANG